MSWQTGTGAPTLPPGPTSSRAWLYGSGAIQYFFARDRITMPRKFDPERFADRMREVSALMDPQSRPVGVFRARRQAHHHENMADYAQSPYAGSSTTSRLSRRWARPASRISCAFTSRPGADHMGMGAPSSVDMLELLTAWVEKGKPPGDLVQARQQTKPPFGGRRAPDVPLSGYPHYQGGDVNKAESFLCKAP